MSTLTKIGYPKEPKLHVHRYVVQVITTPKKGPAHIQFHYCLNLKEVKAVATKAKKGAVVEVFSAVHNFVQAYFKN